MKRNDVIEIIECLGGERRVFHYFKDRYCLDLMGLYMDTKNRKELSVAELKTTQLKRFMQKTVVVDALRSCGDGKINRGDIQSFGRAETIPFVLQLGRWGDGDRGWDQTSRNQSNLVLRLNFNSGHVGQYQKLVKPVDSRGPFEYWGHPISRGKQKTMAWIRMDVDFDTNEVLIEEIQNDWLRRSNWVFAQIKKRRDKMPFIKPNQVNRNIKAKYEDLEYYVEHVLKPYRAIWAEASMLAAIQFIRNDLGVDNIYYHSFKTGIHIKDICEEPPKSMYTKLPKQFGFELTDQAPEFLLRDKVSKRYIRAIENPHWYRLGF